MFDAHAAFCDFYRSLPEHFGCDIDVRPYSRLCSKSPKTAHKRWLQAMRPYTASVLWLEWFFLTQGADAARRAFLKFGVERKGLIKIGLPPCKAAGMFAIAMALKRDQGVPKKEMLSRYQANEIMDQQTWKRMVDMVYDHPERSPGSIERAFTSQC